MSVTVRQLDPQCKPAEYVTLPQLETILPTQVIQEVLTDCEAWEQRENKLNMQAMIYLIIALALYPDCSTREVYRRLLEGLPEPLSLQQEVPRPPSQPYRPGTVAMSSRLVTTETPNPQPWPSKNPEIRLDAAFCSVVMSSTDGLDRIRSLPCLPWESII